MGYGENNDEFRPPRSRFNPLLVPIAHGPRRPDAVFLHEEVYNMDSGKREGAEVKEYGGQRRPPRPVFTIGPGTRRPSRAISGSHRGPIHLYFCPYAPAIRAK